MKVIFASYYSCCQNASGGVQNRLRKIASLLQERGIKTELFNPFETKLEKGDILHVFMLSLDTHFLIQYAKRKGVKVVISTIVPLVGEFKLKIYKSLSKLPLMTTYKFNRLALLAADALITESQQESEFICKNYNISSKKCYVIPNGIDIKPDCGECINEMQEFRKKYVLQVGRFDQNKNQLNVIKALKNSSYDLVLVGGPGDQTYYESCLKEAEGCANVHFLGWLKSESPELISAYSHADTVILPSHYETFGLVAIEGASCGAKLILSNTLPIIHYDVFKNCLRVDPNNTDDIKNKVKLSMESDIPSDFSKNVRSFFSWNSIIDQHIKLYNAI